MGKKLFFAKLEPNYGTSSLLPVPYQCPQFIQKVNFLVIITLGLPFPQSTTVS